MPFLYRGLLISCQRNREKNAASEMYYTLTKVLEIDRSKIKAKVSGISGLVTVGIKDENLENIMDRLILLEQDQAYFVHCLRIRPTKKICKTQLNEIRSFVQENLDSIKGPFKIQVEKRHTPFRSKEFIDAVAPLIKKEVNLTQPATIVLIEVLGDKTGISIIPPGAIYTCLATSNSEKENWFLN